MNAYTSSASEQMEALITSYGRVASLHDALGAGAKARGADVLASHHYAMAAKARCDADHYIYVLEHFAKKD